MSGRTPVYKAPMSDVKARETSLTDMVNRIKGLENRMDQLEIELKKRQGDSKDGSVDTRTKSTAGITKQ